MDWLLEQLANEWAVIKQAPISFLLACVLCLLIAFFAVRWMYQERLTAKDDLLGYYREKLGLQPHDKTRYSGLKNSELKTQGITLATQIRQLAERGTRTDPHEIFPDDKEIIAAKTQEERVAIWRRRAQESNIRSVQRMDEVVSAYNQNYKIDLILLRDEILTRLPRDKRGEFQQSRGEESPVNGLMVEPAADKLEKMAKLLPE